MIEIPAGIVVAGISALAAVIGSLLTFLAHNSTGKIVIKGSSGRTIEVPRDTPHEQLEYLIEQARAIDAATIVIERGVSTSQVWK